MRNIPKRRKRIRAAGGVVVRREGDDTCVVLVHRPKYDDWTIPKGKVDQDEDELACALREVEEETGIACRPGRELASSDYTDRGGRDKHVRYWLMVPETTTWPPEGHLNGEVDEVEWVPLPDAMARLSYERDVQVLASALDGLEDSMRELEADRGSAGGVRSRAV